MSNKAWTAGLESRSCCAEISSHNAAVLATAILSNLHEANMDDDIIKSDLLIVGAGPAGAALACFLASHGKRVVQPLGRQS
jgi:ribulose 1,5-bisphosphate synthetase/thiazole synthase